MSDVSLSQFAADLSRLHILLSLAEGDPDEIDDPRFKAVIQQRLKKDPAQVRQLRRIAAELSMLTSV